MLLKIRLIRQPELIFTQYGGDDNRSGGLPLTLISRYPLTVHPSPAEISRGQNAIVETPQGHITIWNLHPSTALNQRGWEAQRQYLNLVAQKIRADHRPLIVLGDFNTTPEAENYQLIASHLTDVHRTVGRGFGLTFPNLSALPPLPWYLQPLQKLKTMVRIDHIFVSDHFIPQETHVVGAAFQSDHYPVVATLRFAN